MLKSKTLWWKKLIPPVYFYGPGNTRRVERDHVAYALDISRLLDHSIYFCNVDDPAWINLFKFLKRNYNILDAGANIGYLSMFFAKNCPEGMVYSFEPDTQNYMDLSRNVGLNGFKNIQLFKKALGAEPGMLNLYKLYEGNPGANRILSAPPWGGVKSEVVEVTTLDILHAHGQFKKIDLMKIDVEGYELFLLQGARHMINCWKPILFVELAEVNLQMQNCTALSLIEFVESLGYTVWDARDMQPIDKLNIKSTDILCFSNGTRTA